MVKDEYERLRLWYLARLRRAALRAPNDALTPLTLIETDRRHVEKLVIEAAQGNSGQQQVGRGGAIAMELPLVLLLLGVLSGALSLLDLGHFGLSFVALLLSIILTSLSLVLLLLTRTRMRTTANELALLTTMESGRHQLDAAIASLVTAYKESVTRENIIADAASDLLVSFDQELKILSVNQAVNSILGLTREDLVGKYFLSLVALEDMDEVCQILEKLQDSAAPVIFECRLFNSVKRLVDLEWSFEWSSREKSYFAAAKNITDRKNLERARRESVAMLGHDVRTPLTSILMNIELILGGTYGPVTASCQGALEISMRSANRLLNMINQLLDFEKLSEAKMPLQLESCDLRELAAQALDEVKAQAKDIKYAVDSSSENVVVRADRERVLRVIINLLSNAIKYSGGQDIDIACVAKKNYVEVRVRDRGPGIPPEYHGLLFERYERLEAEGSAIEGTGLGLAICKAIVEAHGGLIGVESEVGKGAVFWFSLPRN